MFKPQNSTGSSFSSSPILTNATGLRRAKSNHSFSTTGCTASGINAIGGSSARGGWYLEDDEEDGFEERRERSNSFGAGGSCSVVRSNSLPFQKTKSNSSLAMMSLTGSLTRIGSNSGSNSSLLRSLHSSSRRWTSLIRSMEHLWDREGGPGMGMETSPQDTDRSYRLLRLPNNLRAILVSDPTTDKSAAALSVRVGASQDPPEAPGLAHFCEHMLFLGTDKYPRENTYKDLVNKSGGSSNAFTSMDLTLYKFQASADAFAGVLDVFAQFFICPLFTESATGRELKAVDAENSKNLTNDSRRMWQITKAVATPSHPWSKFSTGSLQTLKEDVPPAFDLRDALLRFYAEHYYAGNMALALVSRDSLDVLEGHVRDKFGAIRDREPLAVREGDGERTAAVRFNNPFQTRVLPLASNHTPSDGQRNALCPPTPNPSYTISGDDDPSTGRLPSVAPLGLDAGMDQCPAVPLIRIVPLRDKKEIRVTWPLPPSRPAYRAPPTRLLSHLLGHEGEGSIFSVLHRAGWASGVHAGLGTSQDDFCLFEVTVALTEEGLPHWQDVASLIFQYVHLIGRASPEELLVLWDELRVISATAFRFQQKSTEYSYAADLARRLQYHQDRHVLSAGHLFDPLEEASLSACLAHMTEEKAILTLSCKDNQSRFFHRHRLDLSVAPRNSPAVLDLVEPWYQIPYQLELFPAHATREWACAHVDSLHLPRPNPFVAEEFEILAPSYEPPSATPSPPALVFANPCVHVWHKVDLSYKQPRAHIVLEFATPLPQRDPAAAELFVRYLEHTLAESTYDGVVAGLGWSISSHARGLTLRFSGFSHKVQTLLHKVLESVLTTDIHDALFRLTREKAIDAYRNIALARPDEHGQMFLSLLLTEGRWAWKEKLQRLESLQAEDLAHFHRELMARNSVTLGVFGNVSEESALGLGELVERLMRRNGRFEPLCPSLQPFSRAVMLDAGVDHRLCAIVPNDADTNSSLSTYFQAGLVTAAQTAQLMLLAQIMKEPCFTQLRTREQLGYIVGSGVKSMWFRSMVAGLSFRVLSKTHGPEDILDRLEAFLGQFHREILTVLSLSELERHKEALITNLLEPPKKMVGEASMHWEEIVNGTLEWKRNQLYADGVREAGRDDLIELFDSVCLNKEKRRVVSVMMHGKHHRPMRILGGEGTTGKDGPNLRGRVVYLKEEDCLAFRAAHALFPCSPSMFTSKY